jgi:hypothetical protein
MNEALVICATAHITAYYKNWKENLKFNNDEYILCDVTNKGPLPTNVSLDFVQDNVINYTEQNVRKTLNFDKNASDKHWWNLGGGRSIIWFYPQFRMLYFYKLYPDYDYYWFFDDDVTFPNNQLQEFIDLYRGDTTDCAITYLFSDLDNSNPSNVPVMCKPMFSFHGKEWNWLIHYPGFGDNQPEYVKEKYGSFFPIVRLSNRALKTLLEEHEKGYYGYGEGYVPTVLNYHNMSLHSFYNEQSKLVKNENILIHHKDAVMLWDNI